MKSIANNTAVKTNAANTKAKLAAARAEFEARKAQEQAVAEAAAPQAFAPEAEEARRMEAVSSAVNTIMGEFNMPSWSRVITGVVLGILVAGGFGWLFGHVLAALIIGAITMTGSLFIGQIIYWLGLIYAMFKGGKVAAKVSGYVINGGIDTTMNKVKGWFAAKPIVQQAQQFTGAFTKPAAA